MTALAATWTTTRLTLRLHRFEATAFVVLAALGFVLAFVVAARLDALRLDPRCYAAFAGNITSQPSALCQEAMNRFSSMVNSEGGKVQLIVTMVPFLAGLLLGTPIVGREVERGTTRLAWALTPSRRRWYLQRLLPVLGLVAIGSFVLGVAGDRLIAASVPGLDPQNAFDQMGWRGVVLAARAVFVFALAVVIGAAMGRMLPALIVAGVVAVIGINGGARIHDRILQSEAVPVTEPRQGDLQMNQMFRLPDGRLITWDEVQQYDPQPTDPNFAGQWPTLPQVTVVVPRERYAFFELREVAALAGGTLVALVATAFIVSRRRPG